MKRVRSWSLAPGCRAPRRCIALQALAGCAALSSWIPTIPPPSFGWFSSSKKLGPLPEFTATVTPKIVWQVAVGKAAPGTGAGGRPDAIYAAADERHARARRSRDGRDRLAHRSRQTRVGGRRRGCVASSPSARTRATCSPSRRTASPLWQVKVTSEVVSPPKVAEGVVVVWSGDGRVFGVSATDGKTRWVYQRNNPPLTVRNFSGGVITRGGLFMGTAGGKLVALDLGTGNLGWEAQRRDAQGRDRARADRRHHVAAARRRQPGVRGRLSGTRRVLRHRFAARSTGRATCRASKASSWIPATSTSPTTRARSRPSTRPPAPRRGSRTSSRSAVPAVRRWSATTSPSSMAKATFICSTPTTAASWDASRPTARRPPPSRQVRRHRGLAKHRRGGALGRRPLTGRVRPARRLESAAATALPDSIRSRRVPSPRTTGLLPCCPLWSSSGARTSASRRCSIG